MYIQMKEAYQGGFFCLHNETVGSRLVTCVDPSMWGAITIRLLAMPPLIDISKMHT
jgi:hypothetical protein